jgi:predicted aspartyl protease
MRIITASLLVACCLPGFAHAQAPTPAKCGQLEIVNKIQMVRGSNYDLVPVSINGAQKDLIFDTGSLYTTVSPRLVRDLHLPTAYGSKMTDLSGRVSYQVATIKEFIAGKMRGTSLLFQIDPNNSEDGAFALDRWQGVDLDVDYGTDTLNMFSQNHCPGAVQYWSAPAVAIIPISMDGNHVIVPVMLDGHEEQAVIDTGAYNTILDQPEAESAFHPTPGDKDTPDIGELNQVVSSRAFSHVFKNLSFGDVAVNNPKITILQHSPGVHIPMTAWRDNSPLQKEKLLIGMDVLRKLHVYFAFGEKKMYISAASVPTPEYLAQATEQAKALEKAHHDANMAAIDAVSTDNLKIRYERFAEARIDELVRQLASHPDDPNALASLCFAKATLKKDLDTALGACD